MQNVNTTESSAETIKIQFVLNPGKIVLAKLFISSFIIMQIFFSVVSLEASDSSDSEEENKELNEDKKEDNNEDEKQEKRKKKKRKESEESVIDHAHQVELTVLDAVENLEERVASASLQVKVSFCTS